MSVTEAESAAPAEAGLVPLSVQQEFLCMWDKGDEMGPFGPRYHIVDGWRVAGEIDVDTLRGALHDVVARHEALRTMVVRADGVRHQRILPPTAPELVVRDLPGDAADPRELRAEELLNELAAGTLSVRDLPLLRAVLGRFDDRDAVLALVAHHTAADAWSMQLIMKDLAAFYAARRADSAPELPEASQYREYAIRQRDGGTDPATAAARRYWRETLRDGQALALPTDRLRSAEPDFSTAWHRFSFGPELRVATAELASAMRSSPFMILLSAFELFAHGITGATDLVVPTFTPGRDGVRFQNAVGSFFNCLPLRTDLAGCATFREVVARTRASCIEAYRHELPFAHILEEAPELMAPVVVDGLASCLFQVIQTPHMMAGERAGDLEISAIRRKVLSQSVGSDIPDGTLLCLEFESGGELIGELGYSSNLYDDATARELVARLRRVLHAAVTAPDARLDLA